MMNWAVEWVSSEGSRWGVDVSEWSHAQNKQFEDALAVYDRDTPDRWQKVAAMIPGKSVADVTRHYQELEDDVSMIEAGLLPVCEYEDVDGKRPAGARRSEQERKKGVPWTEEEHKLFLMGLKKHGKGDWRNISRNFVGTRTPTQVASHAQKYFLRQVSGAKKDKRRASIHDITTSTLDSQPLQPSSAPHPHPLPYGPYHVGRIGYHHNHYHTMEF